MDFQQQKILINIALNTLQCLEAFWSQYNNSVFIPFTLKFKLKYKTAFKVPRAFLCFSKIISILDYRTLLMKSKND